MNRFTIWLTGVTVALIVVAGIVVGCSRGPVLVDYPTPPTYTVNVQGQCVGGFMYDSHELDYLNVAPGCTRVLYPSYPPVYGTPDYAVRAALWDYLITYDSFYHSGLYFDSYLSPMSARYHVTIVNKTSFVNTSSSFDRQYSSQIKSQSAKAKWSNGKTGNYSFPSSNQSQRNKPLTNAPANTGGSSVGNSGFRDRSGPISNTGTRTGTGSTGKTGTKR